MSWPRRIGAIIQVLTGQIKLPHSVPDTCSNLATCALFLLSARTRTIDIHVKEIEQAAYVVSAPQRLTVNDVYTLALRLLKHGNPLVRREAIKVLARAGHEQAVPALLRLLENPNSSSLKAEILDALGYFSSPEILEPLLAGLNGKDHKSRRAAAQSLARVFESEERIFKFSVLKKREAVSSLIKALNDSDDQVRALAASGLGLSESYRAVVPVAAALQDPSVEVRTKAAEAAGTLRDRRATLPLLATLRNSDEDDVARIQALFALRRLEGDVGLDTLLTIADSELPTIQQSGLRVMLKALKDTQSVLLNNPVRPKLDSGCRSRCSSNCSGNRWCSEEQRP